MPPLCGRGGTCAPRSGTDGGGGGAWKGACGRDGVIARRTPSACGGSGGLGVQACDRPCRRGGGACEACRDASCARRARLPAQPVGMCGASDR